MNQETYYVVVNGRGEYLAYTYDGEREYRKDFEDAELFYCGDAEDLAFAEQLAAVYNGTVKEVTITIKD